VSVFFISTVSRQDSGLIRSGTKHSVTRPQVPEEGTPHPYSRENLKGCNMLEMISLNWQVQVTNDKHGHVSALTDSDKQQLPHKIMPAY